jgi:hypothetical protein
LKNEISDAFRAFISDQKLTFNDKQLIRALYILSRSNEQKLMKERDRILGLICQNILTGKFEFKKGNTLATFAEALLVNTDMLFAGSTKP